MPGKSAAILTAALAAFAIGSCAAAASSPPNAAKTAEVTAFVSVNLISMLSDRVEPDQTVLVRDGRIAAVGSAAQLAVPPQAHRIDGHGMYLMPGLTDMHVHLMGATDFPLYLAYGVTTIRQMSGSPGILKLRQEVNEGSVLGPTIFTVGELIDGDPPVWKAGTAVVTTPAEARETVDAQKLAGYDEVKVYDNLLLPQYDAVANEAKRIGIPFVGHIPHDVSIDHALNVGQASIEHLQGYLSYIQRADSPFRATATKVRSGITAAQAGSADDQMLGMANWVDDRRLTEIAHKTVEVGAWNVPTLVQLKNAKRKDEYDAAWKRPGMEFASKAMRDWWNGDVDTSNPAARARLLRVRSDIVRALHAAGAHLLAGTDSPHPFVLPGLALHDELENLVEAGLTPYEALWAATRGPAKFLSMPDEFGVIAPGARADLLLVERNPLDDVGNAGLIAGIMVRGRWLTRDDLHQRLAAGSTR